MRDELSALLAARIRAERDRRGWSLADLAARCHVSKAMLSKIEREEVSPTASVLSRIASGLGLTLAGFLAQEDVVPKRLVRKREQPTWQDPKTRYVRRQVFQSAGSPLELAEISLPPGEAIAFPASAYRQARHVVWVLEGALTIKEGRHRQDLREGDRLEFGPPSPLTYANEGRKHCRYLVALLKTPA